MDWGAGVGAAEPGDASRSDFDRADDGGLVSFSPEKRVTACARREAKRCGMRVLCIHEKGEALEVRGVGDGGPIPMDVMHPSWRDNREMGTPDGL